MKSENTTPPKSNNPFIDALGKLPESICELAAKLTPSIEVPTDELRAAGELARFIALGPLEDLYTPTSRDIQAALTILRMINRGYARRPPTPAYWQNHQAEAKALANLEAPPAGRSSTPSYSITGTSGMGKSTAIDMILSLLPEVVEHDQAINPLLPKLQVLAIKITCPVNRTPRAFITEFFTVMRKATGIDYSQCIARRSNDDELIIEMGRIARLHCLGLLVFDEVQQIAGGDGRLMHLLVRLTNTIQVPVVFVGTPHAGNELRKELATARRMLGDTWRPFAEGDSDWNDIIESIWAIQVLRTPTKLDDALKKKMHFLTCGIPALAKALYTFTQEHLILNTSPGEPESITADLLETIFNDKMVSVVPAMTALRTGEGLEVFNDLLPAELPKPRSWTNEKQLEDAVQMEFHRAAIQTARKAGKAHGLSHLNRMAS